MEFKVEDFSGISSIVLDHRPFFSIIIPCYNTKPNNIKLLLSSIENQNMNDDIEVIISDDCSPNIEYLEVIKEFSSRLSIRTTRTNEDSIHCPGNNRENGVHFATAEWIIFADHDDEFIPDSFKDIKQFIINNNEKYHVICNFKEIEPDTYKEIRDIKRTRNWMHAKFYNLDNLWKARDIHFKKDLVSHEDIYTSSVVKCELKELDINPCFMDHYCYYWKAHPDSVSRTTYDVEKCFLSKYFVDYITSTGSVYIDRMNLKGDEIRSNPAIYNWYLANAIDCTMYQYFYYQSFLFKNTLYNNDEKINAMKKYLKNIMNIFPEISPEYILFRVGFDNAKWYNKVRESAIIGAGQFIETRAFGEFLSELLK